jgi:hypothetical protein
MSRFFIVADACEDTGYPVTGTIEVYVTLVDAIEALRVSDGQYAQIWTQRECGGFEASHGIHEGVVHAFTFRGMYVVNEVVPV